MAVAACAQSTGSVRGRVVDPLGAPFKANTSIDGKPMAVSPRGVFDFGGPTPGRHLLEFRQPGFAGVEIEFDVAAGQALELPAIEMPVAAFGCRSGPWLPSRVRYLGPNATTGGIRGDIRDMRGEYRGGPLGGVRVRLVSDSRPKAQQITSANGQFFFQGLAPGLYVVRFEANGFYPEDLPVRVVAGLELVFEDYRTLDRCPNGNCSVPRKVVVGPCE